MDEERKHLRLRNWDYSRNGIYFVTICCQNKQAFFGSISKNEMKLSEIGTIAFQFWKNIPEHFPHVMLDQFIVMPNHLHGLLHLDSSLVRPRHDVALLPSSEDKVGSCNGITLQSGQISNFKTNHFSKPVKNSVSVIVNQYKSSVKRWCNKNGFSQFQWQSRFYDQILFENNSVDNIREYIYNNVRNWKEDELNITIP